MNEVVISCNNNEGFANVMVSVLSLCISILAIVTSIRTARLPYKKKLLIRVGSYISGSIGNGYHITVTNIGNRPVKLANVGFRIGHEDFVYINKETIFDSQVMLAQGEATVQYYETNEFKRTLINMKVARDKKIYPYVQDTEGKEYCKFFSTINDLV
jgi:hypothetical protein